MPNPDNFIYPQCSKENISLNSEDEDSSEDSPDN